MLNLSQFNSGRIPSMRILARKNRCYALMHFSINTFTDREWGYGDENPELFNPTDFSAAQIAEACRDGGLAGIIIVCKHHDGFCLWPTRTTAHNISHSPFRNGKGDLVREMADACRSAGLQVGFYVSPWDRNHPEYGRPAYLRVYREQLREIYSNYGPAFEAWFDGANGGDGYYGGAYETRKIDPSTYYDWENTWQIVRELQPEAAIFSDVGPDLRWPGNENGLAAPDGFGCYTPHAREAGFSPAPGFTLWQEGGEGHMDGQYFMPPECDVPLRPGWFYHADEDDYVRSVPALSEMYLNSVGAGGFLDLGIAPDRRGRLHENDVRRLAEFRSAVEALNGPDCFSCGFDVDAGGAAVLEFGRSCTFNLIDMAEEIAGKGEGVLHYSIECRTDGEWKPLLEGRAIGLRRMKTFPETAGDALRFNLLSANCASVRLALSCRMVPAALLKKEERKAVPKKECWKLGNGRTDGNSVTWRFGKNYQVHGFVFTPYPEIPSGTPDKYRIEVLCDGGWVTAAEGEFANLRANPIPQTVKFPEVTCNACRMTALRMLVPGDKPSFMECGILKR